MAIAAFGVPVFKPDGNAKKAPVVLQEINAKLNQMGIDSQDVVNIQAEQEFYHVFYRTTAQ